MKDQVVTILDEYAGAGLAAHPGARLSHVCFKFPDHVEFEQGIEQAALLGTLVFREFKGKRIVWCKLHEAIGAGDLCLEWLELVEPEAGENKSGITAIGYQLGGLDGAVKTPSADGRLVYRYQPAHARQLAGMD